MSGLRKIFCSRKMGHGCIYGDLVGSKAVGSVLGIGGGDDDGEDRSRRRCSQRKKNLLIC